MGKKPPRPEKHVESRRNRLVCMVMNAIVVGIDGPNDKRELAIKAVQSLKTEKDHPQRRALWKKLAAILALSDVEFFFQDLGISLTAVVETLENKRVLDEAVVKKIKETANAWANLGHNHD